MELKTLKTYGKHVVHSISWLLKVDGLAEGWEHGVKSDWETQPDTFGHIPFAIKWLKSSGKRRDIGVQVQDVSRIGYGNDVKEGSKCTNDDNDDTACKEEDIESLNSSLNVLFVSFLKDTWLPLNKRLLLQILYLIAIVKMDICILVLV